MITDIKCMPKGVDFVISFSGKSKEPNNSSLNTNMLAQIELTKP